jgi:DNA-binding CsgD family transcriptional regulator
MAVQDRDWIHTQPHVLVLPVAPIPRLSSREAEVLALVAEGLATADIAGALFMSRQAVTYHLGNLFGKFSCGNRAGLVSRAYVLGFLDPTSWPPHVASRAISSASRRRQPVLRGERSAAGRTHTGA